MLIDIGSRDISPSEHLGTNLTVININNPANSTGKLRSVSLKMYIGGDVKVGVFYGSGTSWTCRGYQTITNVPAGLSNHEINLDVVAGDCIGVFSQTGDMYCRSSGSTPMPYKAGDQTGGGTASYENTWLYGLYLYGVSDFLIDSFDESNKNVEDQLYTGNMIGGSQSFTNLSTDYDISHCEFYIRKIGSPTGNVYAKLYAITGTYGSTSKPTGIPLAVSDPVDVSSIPASISLINFVFSTAYRMSANIQYAISIEYSGTNASNTVSVGEKNLGSSHAGNEALLVSENSWTNISSYDLCFYVYGEIPPVTNISVSDSGSGSDYLSASASVPISDTGSGTDSMAVSAAVSISDDGEGLDIFSIFSSITVSDIGSGSETIEARLKGLAKNVYDSGLGGETMEVLRGIAISDNGAALDAIYVLLKMINLSDSGSSSENIGISGRSVDVEDNGIGQEALDVVSHISLLDSAIAMDVVEIAASMIISDSGSGYDDLEKLIIFNKLVSDIGVANENVSFAKNIFIDEAGNGQEALNILAHVIVEESGHGTEKITLSGWRKIARVIAEWRKVQKQPVEWTKRAR